MTKFEKDEREFNTKKNYAKQQFSNGRGYYYATDLSERDFAGFQDVLREDSNIRAAYNDSSWRRDF